MDKILTISIAAYNVENYLINTLNSLMIDDLLNLIEVFIIDDGGNDNSFQIAEEYEKKYPMVFHAVHKKNEGYGSTVNYSLSHATGKYFKILDGDDWFNTNGFYNFVKKLTSIDVDMIITKFMRVNELTGVSLCIDEAPDMTSNRYFFDSMKFSDWFTMHAITYKTDLLRDNKIVLTTGCFYTDSEYNLLPIRYVRSISKINEVVYCYRLGLAEQSVSLKGISKHYKDQYRVLKRLYEEYKDINSFSDSKRAYISNYLVRWSRSYLSNLLTLDQNNIHRLEIKNFLIFLKNNHKYLYFSLLGESKVALLMVLSFYNYIMYYLLHRHTLYKMNKNHKQCK